MSEKGYSFFSGFIDASLDRPFMIPQGVKDQREHKGLHRAHTHAGAHRALGWRSFAARSRCPSGDSRRSDQCRLIGIPPGHKRLSLAGDTGKGTSLGLTINRNS